MKAILLDIEGTTTPIDFVHKTLFPFAKQRIGKYVEQHFNDLETEISQLAEEAADDKTYTIPVDPTEPGSVSAYLEHLIDVDRKSTPLKSIQGNIWKEGYESGELKSIIYDDVPSAFERWKAADKTIAIYSSGSVLAQRLIFKYSDHGDLGRFISEYFDTNIGAKKVSSSYWNIARELEISARDILFISDSTAELDAARQGGFQTLCCVREETPDQTRTDPHRTISSFDFVR